MASKNLVDSGGSGFPASMLTALSKRLGVQVVCVDDYRHVFKLYLDEIPVCVFKWWPEWRMRAYSSQVSQHASGAELGFDASSKAVVRCFRGLSG